MLLIFFRKENLGLQVYQVVMELMASRETLDLRGRLELLLRQYNTIR